MPGSCDPADTSRPAQLDAGSAATYKRVALRPSSKTLIVEDGRVFVRGYPDLAESTRRAIVTALAETGLSPALHGDVLVVPQFVWGRNMAALLGRCVQPVGRRHQAVERIRAARRRRAYPVRLDFGEVDRRARALAGAIEARAGALREVLSRYESAHVADDETARTLDLLTSLEENRGYFVRRIGEVVTFLPGNQPLYALTCFALVPSLMARRVLVRPPRAMDGFFEALWACLEVERHFDNVEPSRASRAEFVATAVRRRPDAVIFTGLARVRAVTGWP